MVPVSRKLSGKAQTVRRQRENERRSMASRARHHHRAASRRSGAYFVGRNEKGHLEETRSLNDLKITLKGWHVNIVFKREDPDKLAGISPKEVEDKLKKGEVSRKQISSKGHIIAALRSLKHLHQGYKAELESTNHMLDQLDALNLSLAGLKGEISDSVIDDAVSWLESFGKTKLARKQTAVKKIVAKGRLSQTIEMLEHAKTLPPQSRAVQLSRACAVFTALRNRIGQWRDKDIVGIMEYNLQREYALRMERDRWLMSQLARFADTPEMVYGFQEIDSQKKEVVEKVREKLNKKVPRDEISRYMYAKKDILGYNERKSGKKKIGFLTGHYGALHKFIKNEMDGKALKKIDYVLLFLDSNKPRFILDELQKDPEPYLEPMMEQFREGVRAFEAKDFKAAKKYFEQAKALLQRIVYPKR